MRIRFTWIVAILALVTIGFLVACSSKYSTSSNGLVVVPTQGGDQNGAPVMETFSLDLSNGHASQINNVNGPPTNGIPTAVILDPAGAYAYVIVYQNSGVVGSVTGIQSFKVGSDGKLAAVGTTPTPSPVALAMDSAGKFLFVANSIPGTITVFSVGSNATLTAVGNPTPLPAQGGGSNPSPSGLAVTRTSFPPQFSFCSTGQTPPTAEYLLVTDLPNNVLLNYTVSSTGMLTPNTGMPVTGIATGINPAGVAVDPCNRFAYVANSMSNSVSAYTICSIPSSGGTLPCPQADFSLQAASIPSAAAGDVPGPIAVDAYGKFVYVVDTGSDQISAYAINTVTGALTAEGTSVTGQGPTSIAIRSDDEWVFVTNITTGTLSQYAIQQATGGLTPVGPITTLTLPSGVAVK
jgi:6-phosphogluconolactonase (cycloisomerase 2 family)